VTHYPTMPYRRGEGRHTPRHRLGTVRDDSPTDFIPRIDPRSEPPRASGREHPSQRTQAWHEPPSSPAGRDPYDPPFDPYEPDGYFRESGPEDDHVPPEPEPRRRLSTVERVSNAIGEGLITIGLVVLLFVFYELYVTDLFAANEQASATDALNSEWSGRSTHFDLTEGHGIAKMYIPALGADYHFTIIEGTSLADLAIGPGHYIGTALPGQPGDFAVAGHRVGQGAPFNDLGLVSSCDAIIVETQTDWFVYRMLPETNEVAGWAQGKGAQPQCSGANDGEAPVEPLTGVYSKTPGQEIVLPTAGDVVDTVPHVPNATITAQQERSLMTLTTCNPKYSATQRLIIHAILVKDWKKDPNHPNMVPPEMQETS